jgi:hypothetical protein
VWRGAGKKLGQENRPYAMNEIEELSQRTGSTKIIEDRSMVATVVLAVLAVVVLIWAGDQALSARLAGTWVVIGLAGLLGVFLGVAAKYARSFEGSCPQCAQPLKFDEPTDRIRCPGCCVFVQGRGESAVSIAEDHVFERPEIGARLVPQLRLPAVCAHCGEAATRLIEFKQTKVEASLAILVGSLASGGLALGGAVSSISGGVPHCDSHDAGFEVTSKDGEHDLWVRSNRFLSSLVQQNKQLVLTLHGQRPTG